MTSGDSDALRSPCLNPALMLCYSGLSQWIFLDDKLSQTADVSEKTTLFSELFFRQIKSLLQCTMQPHKPLCWHNHREKAGWPAAGGTAGWRERGCKGSIGLSSTATECQTMTVTMWHNSYLCPLILLSPCSWHLDGLTLIVQVAIFGAGGAGNLVSGNELFLTES